MTLAVGIDIGGTKIAAVLVDEKNAIVHRLWRRHQVAGYESCLDVIESGIRECLEIAYRRGADVAGAGLSLAAWIGADRQRVLRSANLGFTDRPIGDDLRDRLGLPVVVDNDGNMAAIAESVLGAARGVADFALLTLGTGVGGGVMVDGRLLVGASGLAGELGHVPVDRSGPRCVCGGVGCLELYASGRAVAERARPELGHAAVSATAADVVRAADQGHAGAKRILTDVGRHIAVAASHFVALLDPRLILLGGSLAFAAGNYIVPAATTALSETVSLPDLRDAVRVELAGCGPEAGAVGAAVAILHPGPETH
jgi:glucokinase